LTNEEWLLLIKEFNYRCAYCNELESKENRGIFPDHLIPDSKNGDYVIGNIVPSCQKCNDAKTNRNWEEFMNNSLSPDVYRVRKKAIDNHIKKYNYILEDPLSRFSAEQKDEYNIILSDWKMLHERAKKLRDNLKISEKITVY
jgi:hypothetical protein